MHKRGWSNISVVGALALALAGCGDAAEDAAPAAEIAEDGQPALPAIPVMGPERKIIAFGDSLFAGYNLDPRDSYPEKLENALRAKGMDADVINAGVSGDTSAAGLQRLEFTLAAQETPPALLILELGGNDLLRGLSPEETKANLGKMLTILREQKVPVLIMGMRAPPNYGPEFQAQFDAIYRDLAKEYGAALIPFWLEDIYREPALFQADKIHPTADGIERLVASTLDEVEGALPRGE
ncbi:acyl-CoA thioesterase-1 [Erythromicrobium ramosum]|uniref:Acyl-CoA thioesterase-1 n=1 Tax=Erythrobacter ramosus TaxID=35811 RepID=A0A6I4UNS6_9SPHN|nr:arylesterase [Erythrobacter ramosus]MBB3775496.1 acyl-CoA thioesterase-1 [Erythrobacter ramosus]MXP39404.1 arylesterase [Erythrobacter ramosus]